MFWALLILYLALLVIAAIAAFRAGDDHGYRRGRADQRAASAVPLAAGATEAIRSNPKTGE